MNTWTGLHGMQFGTSSSLNIKPSNTHAKLLWLCHSPTPFITINHFTSHCSPSWLKQKARQILLMMYREIASIRFSTNLTSGFCRTTEESIYYINQNIKKISEFTKKLFPVNTMVCDVPRFPSAVAEILQGQCGLCYTAKITNCFQKDLDSAPYFTIAKEVCVGGK